MKIVSFSLLLAVVFIFYVFTSPLTSLMSLIPCRFTQCESKKLHRVIFAITLSKKLFLTIFGTNFLSQTYFTLFVSQKTGYQLKIYFCLLFSRLTDMANNNRFK